MISLVLPSCGHTSAPLSKWNSFTQVKLTLSVENIKLLYLFQTFCHRKFASHGRTTYLPQRFYPVLTYIAYNSYLKNHTSKQGGYGNNLWKYLQHCWLPSCFLVLYILNCAASVPLESTSIIDCTLFKLEVCKQLNREWTLSETFWFSGTDRSKQVKTSVCLDCFLLVHGQTVPFKEYLPLTELICCNVFLKYF